MINRKTSSHHEGMETIDVLEKAHSFETGGEVAKQIGSSSFF
jgi:hypothetical protein